MGVMDDALLLALWGKTKDRSAESTEYHPLLFHLIDVGVAAEALWALLPAVAGPELRQRWPKRSPR